MISEAVDSLPAKMRQVFELSRKQDLSYQEIADQLAISEKNS
ncbi:sigma factor-like helix-turn-helix DNA-binding protein [Sphingobacterium sp. UBA6645]